MIWQPHAEVATTEVFVAECIAAAGAGSRFPYVLAWRENPGIPIGMLEARPSDFKVEIGYVLAPEYWGQGLMPEAVSSLADLMLERIGQIAIAHEEPCTVVVFLCKLHGGLDDVVMPLF